MSKTNKLAKECILHAMEEVKDSISAVCEIGNSEKVEKLSVAMKTLAEAYKNIK